MKKLVAIALRLILERRNPNFAITPDAEFPVVFAEKGIMQIRIFDKTKYMNLTISGGQAVNAVPDSINILFENEKATLKGKTFTPQAAAWR